MSGSREEERRKLADIINHWNANRLDLFEISQPTEDLEFHGVMRFYFQDRVAGNFATKCIRVSSTATTQDVIETLAEKFRPDMRMLSSPKYSLYEVHVSGEERQLDLDEKPLVVQLNWNKDDREGRFVLKNENDVLPKVRRIAPHRTTTCCIAPQHAASLRIAPQHAASLRIAPQHAASLRIAPQHAASLRIAP
ncbi:afadin-like, partial [Poecilia latipinna]|uniref:afadin-like n=1 Tax=Poecilia latipinna TaxID=48699 RepID=UPI00072DB558